MGQEKFTGERFIPEVQDKQLFVEHFQRYLSVKGLVTGRRVLDAACGEGYGSSILAQTAASVIGVDISEETIRNAQQKYGTLNNVCFFTASIADLRDVPTASIDVVVSFETIEHVSADIQYAFLGEIKRVLVEDGLLIMSTPNRKIYSDLFQYQNKYHIKEFYTDEFKEFLHSQFKNICLYSQYDEVVSLIESKERNDEYIFFLNEENYPEEGKYYIALASNGVLPMETISSVFRSNVPIYIPERQRILRLQEEEEERNQHIAALNQELEDKENRILELQDEVVRRGEHIIHLDSEIEKKDQQIAWMEKQLGANEEFKTLEDNLAEKQSEIKRLQGELQKQNKEILLLKDTAAEKDEQLLALKNENACLKQTSIDLPDSKNNEIEELKQIIRNKEGHIELLLEVERAYDREKGTDVYRLAKCLERCVDFFFPRTSRRRFFLRMLRKMVRNPKLMLRVVSIKRVKNFYKYYKLEGMDGVVRRYNEAEREERIVLNPAEGLQINNDLLNKEKRLEEYIPIDFPVYSDPLVSIVIPVYNQFGYTYNCLQSIYENSRNVAYEILIADDGSTDLTKDIESIVKGISVIRHDENLRFLRNCNYAAQYAKGKYILFLNNDTQVQENWLKPLVDLAEKDKTIGMVGSKLIYSDGRLQEAGGIVWKDASAWNFGHLDNPEKPEYSYVRDVDYISGAAIMIRNKLWGEIGGFDERFAPAYYEDTDLAFEVRRRGFRVIYQPLSVVVHFEGVSNGTDTSSGQKAFQVVNQKKFYEKWKAVLEKENFANGEHVFLAKDRSREKKHILVVDHYVPHYDRDAGGKCSYMYLELFRKMGMQVIFIGDNFYKHEPYSTKLNQDGIEILYGNYYKEHWKDWVKENGDYLDYVYLQRPHISIKYIDWVKKYSKAKVFYFAHDLHHIREYRQYQLSGDPKLLKSSEKWKKLEYELFEKADVGHVVGSYEQAIMQKAFPDKPIRNIPLYIYEDLPKDINQDFSARMDLLYVGGFSHPPNVDAVLWFAKEIFPRVLQRHPDMRWHVVGGKAPEEVKELAGDHIIIEGFLPDEDLERLYRTCRMAVVPLRFGAGVKGKVVEAAYYQIPLVTTSIGAEGLDSGMGNMVIVDDEEQMAEKIADLYEDRNRLGEMSVQGSSFISQYFRISVAERVIMQDLDTNEG